VPGVCQMTVNFHFLAPVSFGLRVRRLLTRPRLAVAKIAARNSRTNGQSSGTFSTSASAYALAQNHAQKLFAHRATRFFVLQHFVYSKSVIVRLFDKMNRYMHCK
jgi:hypothetical protein